MGLRHASLRLRIVLLAIVGVAPAAAFIGHLSWAERQERLDEAQDHALRLAQTIGLEERQIFAEVSTLLTALAHVREVISPAGPECPALLADLLRNDSRFTNLGVADPAGDIVCSGVPLAGPVNIADRSYFRGAMARHEVAAGTFQVGRVTGRPALNVGLRVEDGQGRLVGVVYAAVDLSALLTRQEDHLAGLPDGTVITTVDRDGRVLARIPEDPSRIGTVAPEVEALGDALEATSGLVARRAGGERHLHAFARLPSAIAGGDLLEIVTIPEERLLAPIQRTLARDLIGLATLAAITLLLALIGSERFVVRPVRTLATAAGRLGAGELAARSGLRHRPDEVGALARAFDAMAERLELREAERRAAVAALARSDAHHRALVRDLPVGFYRSTPDGRILEANPALVQMLGYAHEAELLQVNLRDGVYADSRVRARLIAAHTDHRAVAHAEVEWRRKDGSVIAVRLVARVLRNERGETEFESLAEDVTEQRDLQARFLQSQKMEAVGRLAGGIAHDFNNLLAITMSCAELLQRATPEDDARRGDIDAILRAADRGRDLTRQLLAFSRQRTEAPRDVDANAAVTEVQAMLRRLLGADVTIVTALGGEVGAVRIEPGQLEQVLVNLAVNARDAMPGGGRLEITTARHGDQVRLEVRDTGVGMDEAVQSRIFDPFFTTKGPEGTGLGLATVYGIVTRAGGEIRVRSAPGEGTTFLIDLPGGAPRFQPSEADTPVPIGEAEPATVLVAEDEEIVREVICRALASRGHTLLVAGSGEEALATARAHDGPIELLVTDVVMPGMDGRELAETLRGERPDLRVLFVSGYAGDALTRYGVDDHAGSFLQKPFTLQALRDASERALRQGRKQRARRRSG